MRIDNVIANPPYGANLNPNFHNKIMNEIKPKEHHWYNFIFRDEE